MPEHRWQHLHFYLLLLLLPACSGPRHRVERDLEEGVPRVRTLGAPRHRGAPFRLVREQVFGDPALGAEGTLTQPRGYLEVPGGLAVFDDGDHALKVYEDDGRLRFRMGRRGQGPGEFEDVWMNHGLSPQGRVVLTDGTTARLTLVDPVDGSYETVPMANATTWDAAQVGPDRFVIIHPTFSERWGQLESLDRVDRTFTVVDTMASVPPGRVQRVPIRTAEGQAAFLNVSKSFWPFFSWWVQDARIAICRGAVFRVELFDLQGRKERILEWDAPLSTVTDSMWAATQRTILRTYGVYGPTVWAALERPDRVPSVEGVRLDDAGRVWALRYIPTERWGGPADPKVYWDVLDVDGTWLGRQPTPGVARYFGRNTCYVTEDAEGGSVVVRYRLESAGSNPDPSSTR
jgi:hypothetical protein